MERENERDGSKLLERVKLTREINNATEQLAEKDAVSDALWDLRGQVLIALKEEGYLAPDSTGPDNIGTIHTIIRRLLEMV